MSNSDSTDIGRSLSNIESEKNDGGVAACDKFQSSSMMPERNADYLKPTYWDQRFETEDTYEWFKGYNDFRDILLRHVSPSEKVLIVGCGNSQLSEDLYQDGIHQITSTDLSPVVIRKMGSRAKERGFGQIQWRVADMLSLPFSDAEFDVVIEKGAMDVLFVDNESPWNPSLEVCTRVSAMVMEAHRVLKPTGIFLSITFGQPHFRRPLLEAEGLSWAMEYETFGEDFHYYVYTLRKGTRDPSGPAGTAPAKPVLAESMEHKHMDDEDYLLRSTFLDD